jgi:hypothetical protein
MSVSPGVAQSASRRCNEEHLTTAFVNMAGLRGISSFAVKLFLSDFRLDNKYTFNLSLSRHMFTAARNIRVCATVSNKSQQTSVNHYTPMAIVNRVSIVLEFFMHGHIFHCSDIKFSTQGFFTKTKSTTINFITFLDKFFIGCCQEQFYSIYLDLSRASDTVFHSLLLYVFNSYALSAGYTE